MLELARVKIGPLYVDTVFSDVSIVVIDNTFSCKSNLWNPFPADVREIMLLDYQHLMHLFV